MKITGKLNKLDLFLLQEAFSGGHKIESKCGASHLVGTETVKIHSEGWGDWYLFGGHCMWWGMIQANSWEDAYEIYLEEFVPCDEAPEDDKGYEYGTFDSSGGWYSEVTTSCIVGMDSANFDEWDITITEIEEN